MNIEELKDKLTELPHVDYVKVATDGDKPTMVISINQSNIAKFTIDGKKVFYSSSWNVVEIDDINLILPLIKLQEKNILKDDFSRVPFKIIQKYIECFWNDVFNTHSESFSGDMLTDDYYSETLPKLFTNVFTQTFIVHKDERLVVEVIKHVSTGQMFSIETIQNKRVHESLDFIKFRLINDFDLIKLHMYREIKEKFNGENRGNFK